MKRLLAALILILLTAPVNAQDFDKVIAEFNKGVAAHTRGDYGTALQVFKIVAEQNHAAAQYNLGVMYSFGRGVPQDYVQAYMWFNLAAAQGNEKASQNRNIVAKLMTCSDISKAQRMVHEWREAHPPKSAN
jgi:TPR repeat protein